MPAAAMHRSKRPDDVQGSVHDRSVVVWLPEWADRRRWWLLASACSAAVRFERQVRSRRHHPAESARRLRLPGVQRDVRVALALVLVASARTGGAEPCAPRAALDGDAEAVARVGQELTRLGVTVESRRDPTRPVERAR